MKEIRLSFDEVHSDVDCGVLTVYYKSSLSDAESNACPVAYQMT